MGSGKSPNSPATFLPEDIMRENPKRRTRYKWGLPITACCGALIAVLCGSALQFHQATQTSNSTPATTSQVSQSSQPTLIEHSATPNAKASSGTQVVHVSARSTPTANNDTSFMGNLVKKTGHLLTQPELPTGSSAVRANPEAVAIPVFRGESLVALMVVPVRSIVTQKTSETGAALKSAVLRTVGNIATSLPRDIFAKVPPVGSNFVPLALPKDAFARIAPVNLPTIPTVVSKNDIVEVAPVTVPTIPPTPAKNDIVEVAPLILPTAPEAPQLILPTAVQEEGDEELKKLKALKAADLQKLIRDVLKDVKGLKVPENVDLNKLAYDGEKLVIPATDEARKELTAKEKADLKAILKEALVQQDSVHKVKGASFDNWWVAIEGKVTVLAKAPDLTGDLEKLKNMKAEFLVMRINSLGDDLKTKLTAKLNKDFDLSKFEYDGEASVLVLFAHDSSVTSYTKKEDLLADDLHNLLKEALVQQPPRFVSGAAFTKWWDGLKVNVIPGPPPSKPTPPPIIIRAPGVHYPYVETHSCPTIITPVESCAPVHVEYCPPVESNRGRCCGPFRRLFRR